MRSVVTVFGHDDGPGLLHGGNAPFANMNESLGNMMAGYIGDVQATVGQGVPPSRAFGVPTTLVPGDTSNLLHVLGRDPSAYASIVQAQGAYTAAQIQDVVARAADHQGTLQAALDNAVHPGSVVDGLVTRGRADQLYETQQHADAVYNAKIDEKASWGQQIWDLTGGKQVKRVSIGGGYINGQIDDHIQSYADQFKVDHGPHATGDVYNAIFTSLGDGNHDQVQSALQGTMSDTQIADYADHVRQVSSAGFDMGYGLLGHPGGEADPSLSTRKG
jgi:hypothetical protein